MIRIQLATKPPENFPANWVSDDGNIYFDLFPDTDVRVSRTVTSLNTLNKLKRDTSEEFDMPDTPKNAWFFGRVHLTEEVFLVSVFAGTVWVPYTQLLVNDYNEADGIYSVELLGDSWYDYLEGRLLSELQLGGIIYNQANVEATWADGVFAMFPPINYNFFITQEKDPPEGTIIWNDLRPVYNIGQLMQKMFADAGYSFESPFLLESDVGSNLYAYLLKSGWGGVSNPEDYVEFSGTGLLVDLEALPDRPGNEILGINTVDSEIAWIFADPISGLNQIGPDVNNRWDGEVFQLEPRDLRGLVDIEGTIVIRRVVSGSGRMGFGFSMTAKSPQNFKFDLSQGDTPDIEVDFGARNLSVEGLNLFFSYISEFAGQLEIDYNLKIQVNSFLPEEESYVPYAQTINPEYTCMAFLEGVMHFMDGILEVNEAQRSVTLHIPTDTSLPTRAGKREFVPGFYKMQSQKIEVQPKSMSISRGDRDQDDQQNLPTELDFDTGDAAFEILEYMEDRYSYVVGKETDLADIQEDENPFFSKTLDLRLRWEQQNFAAPGAPTTKNYARPILPAIWGSSDTQEIVYDDIKPRILLFYGIGAQNNEFMNYERQFISDWPYLSQFPPQEAVAYSIPITYDFAGKLFYDNNPLRKVDVAKYEFLVHLEQIDVYEFDFSRPVNFEYDMATLTFLPVEIKDFSNVRRITTPVSMVKINE